MTICFWCKKETTINKSAASENPNLKYANKEHVFPECAGGRATLNNGEVCEDCNNSLSKLDNALKYGNIETKLAYQRGNNIVSVGSKFGPQRTFKLSI